MSANRAFTPSRAWIALGILAVIAFGAYSTTVSSDFAVYYRAGAQALAGDARLYPKDMAGSGAPVQYFRAAPAVAWLFAPFAVLPFTFAAFLFFIVKLAGLVGVVNVATRMVGVPQHGRWTVTLGAFAAAGGYMIEEMRYGNAHLLVLFAIVLALYLAHRGGVILPASLLALSIAIKLAPLLVAIYLAVTGRVKVAFAALAGFLVLLLLPALTYGWDVNTSLMKTFASSAAQIADQPRNHSMRGVVMRYMTDAALDGASYPRVNVSNLSRVHAAALWFAALAGLGGFLLATLRRESKSPLAVPLKDSLVLVAMLLCSTHTQRIHFSWLFFPCCVLMALMVNGIGGRYRSAIRWTLISSAIVGALLPIVLPGRRLSLAYEMGSPYFFVALALFFLVAWLIRNADDFSATGHAPGSPPPR